MFISSLSTLWLQFNSALLAICHTVLGSAANPQQPLLLFSHERYEFQVFFCLRFPTCFGVDPRVIRHAYSSILRTCRISSRYLVQAYPPTIFRGELPGRWLRGGYLILSTDWGAGLQYKFHSYIHDLNQALAIRHATISSHH